MNGNRSSAYSDLFLALGGLVVVAGFLRVVWAFFQVRSGVGRAASGVRASPVLAPLAGVPGRLLLAAGALLLLVVVAVCVGALRRRPWALGASVALLGTGAAAGLGVAVFQLSALLRGVDRTPEAAEIGYGPVISYWRIASVVIGLLVAAFCAAAVRRFASEETRREFRR